MIDGVGERFERLVGHHAHAARARTAVPGIANRRTRRFVRSFSKRPTKCSRRSTAARPAHLCEELGDFLFEAVFLARISEEAGDFAIGDAIDAICDKLVRRHPHVFAREAGDPALTSGQVIEKWETLKARERAAAGAEAAKTKTTLSGVPKTLPSLLRAYEVSARAAAVGFDWSRPADVLDKIEEEVAEVRREVESGATGDLVAGRGGDGRPPVRDRQPVTQARHRA